MTEERTIVLGAGPAAAYRLAKADYPVSVLEKDEQVGGLGKTLKYKDCYFDIGGHRFFTRVEEVKRLWLDLLGDHLQLTPRQSRIFYKGKLFDYPIKPVNALVNLGPVEALLVLASFIRVKLFPYREINTFEEWVSQQFGRRLFRIFFKSYTEKLWGFPCNEISSEWAAQRIKGLSLKSILHSAFLNRKSEKVRSLIQEFLYPELGPGMMYTKMAGEIDGSGGEVIVRSEVIGVGHRDGRITSVRVRRGDEVKEYEGGHFLSSIPITEFLRKLDPAPPAEVMEAASALSFRSHLSVNLLIDRKEVFLDNWIYIHSEEIRVGRIQNYKNWSSKMVYDPKITTLGLEYFCGEHDEMWNTPDEELLERAKEELAWTKLVERDWIFDGFVMRTANAYPVYQIGYQKKLAQIVSYLSGFENLACIGRAGQYQYNNMDHSMLSGLLAAGNIIEPGKVRDIWSTKEEDKYMEY